MTDETTTQPQATVKSNLFLHILGFLLIAAGVAAYFLLPDRGDLATLALVAIGGFFVSQSRMKAAISGVISLLKSKSS